MPFTELPADLKLEILKYLDSWEDKNSFAKIDKSTWDTCLNTYDSKVYRINQKSINILRLSTSKSIELPEANISNKLLKLLLECAYKATHIKLPREETCQNAKKKVLSYTSLHMKQSPITILAFEEEEREWLTLTKTLLYTRLQSPPSIVYYDEVNLTLKFLNVY
jgi:hypothetical protein